MTFWAIYKCTPPIYKEIPDTQWALLKTRFTFGQIQGEYYHYFFNIFGFFKLTTQHYLHVQFI